MTDKKRKEYRVTVTDPYARELLPGYLARRKAQILVMRDALEAGDFERVQRAGHAMYGSGAAYGLDQVSVIGDRLEQAALRKDRAAVDSLLGDLAHYLEHLRIC